MAHHSFAQRAWLPQEKGCGLAGPVFLTQRTQRVWWVSKPLPWQEAGAGRTEEGSGREYIPPRAELWVQP